MAVPLQTWLLRASAAARLREPRRGWCAGAGARTRNCSFILCRRAPPLVPAARHFLCPVLATCFLCWELPRNLATYSKMGFWGLSARWMTSSLS